MSDAAPEAPGPGAPGAAPREGSGATGFRRDEALRRLAGERFDVLVVGGGATGAGVALDAASRGLRTALVDRGDFASGTSSRSSKMIHGGLRYLQQREIRLVYESLAERQRLLDNAPHLVTPLPFLIPLLGREGAASRAVARSYASALWLYDLTGGLRIGARHRRVRRDEALAHLPTLRADRLAAGFLYVDARADDARLTLALVRTAVLDYGAAMANYAAAVGYLTDGRGRVCGARIRPAVRPGGGGAFGEAAEGPDFDVRASVVVNATGVWADEVRSLDDEGGGARPPTIRPAKGVHVTVPAARLPCDVAAVVPVPGDRRSVFVVPWPEAGLVYVGTTDTDYSGPLDDPACTPEDVDYLLAAVNAATTSGLTRDDVTGVWAGLRPLLAAGPGGRRPSARTADLSRRHTVETSAAGVVTVTGGKLTTYRKMAEDVMAAVVPLLPERRAAGPCVTRRLRLRGAARPGAAPAGAAAHGGAAHGGAAHGGAVDGGAVHGGGGASGSPTHGGAVHGGRRASGDDPAAEGVPLPGGVPALRGPALDAPATGGGPIPGGPTPGGRVPEEVMTHLRSRYGSEAEAVLAVAEGRPELLDPVVEGLPYLGAEVVYAARAEMAISVEDVLSRRTRALLMDARGSAAAAGPVAALLAPELGWTAEQAAARAERFARSALAALAAAGLPAAGPR